MWKKTEYLRFLIACLVEQELSHIDSVDEDEISLVSNPLLTQEQAFARINRNADRTHRYAGMTASQIEEDFRNRHPERFSQV